MARRVLVVAPHPDDETLGCGGTLLRHVAEGDEVHWLIVTEMRAELGFPRERIEARKREIETVGGAYGFRGIHRLAFPTTRLDTLPAAELVDRFREVFATVQPEIVYLPFRGDA